MTFKKFPCICLEVFNVCMSEEYQDGLINHTWEKVRQQWFAALRHLDREKKILLQISESSSHSFLLKNNFKHLRWTITIAKLSLTSMGPEFHSWKPPSWHFSECPIFSWQSLNSELWDALGHNHSWCNCITHTVKWIQLTVFYFMHLSAPCSVTKLAPLDLPYWIKTWVYLVCNTFNNIIINFLYFCTIYVH